MRHAASVAIDQQDGGTRMAARIRKTRSFAIAASIALMATACGGDKESTAAEDTTSESPSVSTSVDPTPSESPTPNEKVDPYAPNIGGRALKVGQSRRGTGVITTVLEVKRPYPPALYREPNPGKVWLGIRAKTCVKSDQTETAQVFWGEWAAVDKNFGTYPGSSTSWDDFPVPQYPSYGEVNPGECVQGWLLVDLPQGKKIKKIAYRPGGQTIAEWKL